MDPANPQRPEYVAYPRKGLGDQYGTVEQLKALGESYFSMGNAFLLSTILYLLLVLFLCCAGGNFVAALVTYAICALFCYITLVENVRLLAFGRGWRPSTAVAITILVAATWFLGLGILLIGTLQGFAVSEMKKYGLKPRIHFTKSDFRKFLENRIEREKDEQEVLTSFVDTHETG